MKASKHNAWFFLLLFLCSIQQSFGQYNYGEVLQKSIFFYEAQRSGKLPADNRVNWRGDSGMEDGNDVGHDLKGGWYDAGDHVKFGFPMAFSTTALAWGVLEYKNGFVKTNQLAEMKKNLRWVADYFIKCHTAPNELWGQVGNGQADHAWWGSAEVMPMARPAYKIDAANPGSDLAAETAAALAATSMVFASDDPTYSAKLLQHAVQLYQFADTYRGKYSDVITDAANFYRSWSGYQDELVWGAIWLYKATGDASYLAKAKEEYKSLNTEVGQTVKSYKWGLAWDDKSYGCYVLMAQLTGEQEYIEDTERHLNYWTDEITTSPGGLAWLTQWGSLRHTSNTSLLAFIYSDFVTDPAKKQKYYNFAVKQANYILGDNPKNRSYVVGFGNNPPKNPHHRTAHGTWTNNLRTGGDDNGNNRHILYGALVGGPGNDDEYVDDRGDYIANEVACDYNACFTGVMARMVDDFGGTALSTFPIPETPKDEFFIESKVNANGNTFTEPAIWVYNHSSWPARTSGKLSVRYFVDLSEGFAAGLKLSDYSVTGRGAGTIGSLMPWDEANHIYYVEVDLQNESMYPGGISESRREVQVRIAAPHNVSAGAWNANNDWSFQAGNSLALNTHIPIYEDGQLIFGAEPQGGGQLTASFTADKTTGYAPLAVSFDASASSDPDNGTLTYTWNFGDGNTGTGKTVNHTFTTPGTYEVTLTVSNTGGSSAQTSKTIVANQFDNTPTASFTADKTSGFAPLAINFDASASSSPSGDSLSYAWDFGDGNTATGKTASHTFSTAGNYTVTLTVTNPGGLNAQATKDIEVREFDSTPTASFTMDKNSGVAPLLINFDASASSSPINDSLTYQWNFGDGNTAAGKMVSHSFTTPGSYTATLTVADKAGKTASATKSITVSDTSNCTEGNYLRSVGNQLYDSNGNKVRLTGVNWFGFETALMQPHGLWTRDMKSMLIQIKDLGFNCLRVPWSNAIVRADAKVTVNSFGTDSYTGISPMNAEPSTKKTPLELLDLFIEYCQELNLKVILDNHSREPDGYLNEALWYTANVSEQQWIDDWVFLANRYKGKDAVIGMDINNEPHGPATWGNSNPATDWNKAAERCGNAILAANPDVLIFVEGIEKVNGETYWWGGNLAAAGTFPVVLTKPEKLVYSFHEYGPSVFEQPHFSDPNFPNNMPGIWNEKFHYLHQQGTSHLLMGEFGAKQQTGTERVWFENIMNFGGDIYSWTFWSWNPNSGDTGGLLDNNWSDLVSWKYDILKPHLAPEIPNGCGGGGPQNNAPVARIQTDKISGKAPLTVEFNASQSSDPDGDTLTYTWNFGGGNTAGTMVANYTFTTPGVYNVSLLVDDSKGGKATANISITVEADGQNQAPVARISADKTSGFAPLTVQFNANQSSDPDGDTLTYAWNFGDGNTATGKEVSHTFQTVQAYTVTLTVSDGNASDMASTTITVRDSSNTGNCDNLLAAFDMPRSNALPSIAHTDYTYAHVYGTTSLDLSNLTKFTFQWDNEPTHNGLHQLSIATNDGVPTWWKDLQGNATNSFLEANPELIFSGTGFDGLDGTYYVGTDAQNGLILVEKSGAYAIYFSTNSTPPFACASVRTFTTSSRAAKTFLSGFPNPVDNSVTLQGIPEGQYELFIYDVNGHLKMTKKANKAASGLDVGLKDLDKGIYIIHVKTAGYYKQLRILKK